MYCTPNISTLNIKILSFNNEICYNFDNLGTVYNYIEIIQIYILEISGHQYIKEPVEIDESHLVSMN